MTRGLLLAERFTYGVFGYGNNPEICSCRGRTYSAVFTLHSWTMVSGQSLDRGAPVCTSIAITQHPTVAQRPRYRDEVFDEHVAVGDAVFPVT